MTTTTSAESWASGSTTGVLAGTGISAADRAVPRVKTRDLGFDIVRLIASILIVWSHSPRSETMFAYLPLGSFGTSFFTAASIYFLAIGLQANPDRTFWQYARVRFTRLYLPFLSWSVLYLAFRDACRHWITHEPMIHLTPMNLLSGGEAHLWFLPFALLTSLLAFPIIKAALTSPRNRGLFVLLCTTIGVALMLNRIPEFELNGDSTSFWRVSWYVLPSVFFGAAIGLSDDLIFYLREFSPLTPLLAVMISIPFILYGVPVGATVWSKNIAGTAWLLAALSVPQVRWQNRVARLAPLGFGLYLIHPMILGCMRAAAHIAHLHQTAALDLIEFTLAVVLGLVAATLFCRSSKLRWLVP